MTLLRDIGKAYQLMCDYSCEDAIVAFRGLPKKQLNTGWVSGQIARCYFECGKYNEAKSMYEAMLKQEPYRLEGLEYYSNCLWHLKKQVELVYISKYASRRSL